MSKDIIKSLHIGIVSSRFNASVVEQLLGSCTKKLISEGVHSNNISHTEVPGALEIPVVANAFALSNKFDVLIGVGAVIRGETYHFEVVSDQSAFGLMQVQLSHNLSLIHI